METTQTHLLTAREARRLLELNAELADLEARISGLSYDRDADLDRVRGAARTAAAIAAAKDHLFDAVNTASAYGHCPNAQAALGNR